MNLCDGTKEFGDMTYEEQERVRAQIRDEQEREYAERQAYDRAHPLVLGSDWRWYRR